MCAVSMVYDSFKPRFDQVAPVFYPVVDPNAVHLLIEEFRKSLAEARKKDAEEGAPDCFDPEKAKLSDRVAELERRLAEMGK